MTWKGACKIFIRLNQALFSSLSIKTGNNNIPGAAITMREIVTCVIATPDAVRDLPTIFPFSSSTSIPWIISFCLIKGMLTQLAAAVKISN